MCDRFPKKFDVQTLILVVNIKFPRATYHTIVPLTEELYYLNNKSNFIVLLLIIIIIIIIIVIFQL